MFSLKLPWFVWALTLHLSLYAQQRLPPFVTHTYTAKDGLPHNYVLSVSQDRHGYLWVGTRYGLCRFDGRSFQPANFSNAENHMATVGIFDRGDDKLWLLTRKGIVVQEGDRLRPLPDAHRYGNILLVNDQSTQQGSLWAYSASGIQNLDSRQGPVPAPPGQGEDCWYALHTPGGWFYNLRANVVHVASNGDTQSLKPLLPPSLYVVIMGYWNNILYVYTNNGVYSWDLKTVRSLYDAPLRNKHIYAAFRDTDGRIWAGTAQDGIMVSAPGEENRFSTHIPLSNNLISGFYQDKEGHIWIAGFEGLVKVGKTPFEWFGRNKWPYSWDLNTVTRDREGRLFFFSETFGMIRWDGRQLRWEEKNAWRRKLMDAVGFDWRNQPWFISRNNRVWTVKLGKLTEQTHLPNEADPEIEADLVCDSFRRKIWIPGRVLWWGDDRGFVVFQSAEGREIPEPRRLLSLPGGRLLVATKNNGVWLIDSQQRARLLAPADSIPAGGIQQMLADPLGGVWLGFHGSGLWHASLDGDTAMRVHRRFTSASGLPNDVVQSMTFDGQGRLWVATMAGISIIYLPAGHIPAIPVIHSISSNEGVPTTGMEYGRLAKDEQDNIWFSTQYGIMKFRPGDIALAEPPPRLSIENVWLNMQPTDWSHYTDSVAGLFRIPRNPKLKYHENTLTLTLNAISMASHGGYQYSYRMPGRQNAWSHPFSSNTVSFVELPPGRYTFEVRARKWGSGWSKPVSFPFTIELPFWRRDWFLLLIGLTVIAAMAILYRYRKNQQLREFKIRSQLASDLHDDLGGTLHGITVFANLATLEPDNKQHLARLQEGTLEAVSGLRDMIWVLDDRKDNLEDLISRLEHFAGPLCESHHITFRAEVLPELNERRLGKKEKRNLYMILKEAIHNAVQHSRSNQINLSVSLEKEELVIRVSDDGQGFRVEEMHEGNGLINMKTRATEIGYQQTLRSNPGMGTTLVLKQRS